MCDNGTKDEDISIEQVEGRLWDFQNRLTEYGKDMFGDDFVLMALADRMGSQNKEVIPQKSLDEMIPALPGRNAIMAKKGGHSGVKRHRKVPNLCCSGFWRTEKNWCGFES